MSKKSKPDLLLGTMMLGILLTGIISIALIFDNDTSVGQAIACIAAAITFTGGLQVLINFLKN